GTSAGGGPGRPELILARQGRLYVSGRYHPPMALRRKITVVGAGNVGATCAQVLATRDYASVVLVDIKENLPQGKALDINQMGPVLGYEPSVVGSNGYDETAGSEIVYITPRLPRSPRLTRD